MDMGLICMVKDFFDELGRNEIYAFAVPDHEITRHNGHAADSDGHVDARQHYVPDGCRIGRTEIRRHIDLGDAIQVANAAVHNQPTTVRGFHHVVEETHIHDGAVHFLSIQIHHEHIAGLEHVDGGLIG